MTDYTVQICIAPQKISRSILITHLKQKMPTFVEKNTFGHFCQKNCSFFKIHLSKFLCHLIQQDLRLFNSVWVFNFISSIYQLLTLLWLVYDCLPFENVFKTFTYAFNLGLIFARFPSFSSQKPKKSVWARLPETKQ